MTPPPVFDDIWSGLIWLVVATAATAIGIAAHQIVRRLSRIDDTVGETPADPDNTGATLTEMSSLSVAQGQQILEQLKWWRTLFGEHMTQIDTRLDHHDELHRSHKLALDRLTAQIALLIDPPTERQ